MSEDMTGDVNGWSPDPSEPAPEEHLADEHLADDSPDEGPVDEPDLAASSSQATSERTGNPVVDSVLDSLRDLENLPVSEHVAVFEAAHDRLRSALSDAGDPRTDG